MVLNQMMSILFICKLVALGFGVGTLGTLIGAGGGFILMPVLLLMYPVESAQDLTAISLAVVFLNAFSGSIAYGLKRRIDYRSTIIFSLAAAPGTLLGAYVVGFFPRDQFQLVFGVLMGVMAIYLLVPKKKRIKIEDHLNSKYPVRRLVDSSGQEHKISYSLSLGIALSLLVGFVSSLLGIGGGIVHVPAMVNLLNFPVHIATATSHSILAVMAAIGTSEHIHSGHLDSHWPLILALSPGVILGAQLGAFLSPRMKDAWIMRALALALMTVAIRFIAF